MPCCGPLPWSAKQLEAQGLHWDLEPGLVFLNHGSFGLAPRELLAWRNALLAEIERDPVAFLVEALPPRHRALAQQGQRVLLQALGLAQPIAPASMQAAMAAVPLPLVGQLDGPALQARLKAHGFQVPVIPLRPHEPNVPQFLRIACFAYNDLSDVERLAEAVGLSLC